jgi:hypothetical protein
MPDLSDTLTTLFNELLEGPSPDAAYMLNSGDAGLLRSLDKLTAAQASAVASGGASIAAHVDHLRYGLSLLNRWIAGESPFGGADWAASWRKTTVSDAEWQRRRDELGSEARRWLENLRTSREVSAAELNVIVGSIAHLAYHVGAIRQIDRAARGPSDS